MTSSTQYRYSHIFQKIFHKEKNITTTVKFWKVSLKKLTDVPKSLNIFIQESNQAKIKQYSIKLIVVTYYVLNINEILMYTSTRRKHLSIFHKHYNIIFKYLENEFLDALYWEYKYNTGQVKNFMCPGGDEVVGPCPIAPSDRNILYENRLLGVPR